MVTLSDVLAIGALGLTPLTPGGTEPVAIRWAHVTELADPTPWLFGGELLLTTGLEVFRDPLASATYCERLRAANVAALGISTGPSLPHDEVPAHLTAAAAASGLPLIHVPERVPLQSVVHAVADALNAEQTSALRAAIRAQRVLAEAASRGFDELLARLARTAGFSCAVFDHSGQPIAEHGAAVKPLLAALKPDLYEALYRPGRHTTSHVDSDQATVVLPLRSGERVLGALVATKPAAHDEYDRTCLALAVSLLALLLELRRADTEPDRQRRHPHSSSNGQAATTDFPPDQKARMTSLITSTMSLARSSSFVTSTTIGQHKNSLCLP